MSEKLFPLSEGLSQSRPRVSGDPYAVYSRWAAEHGSRLCGRFATLAGTTRVAAGTTQVCAR